MSPPSAKPRCCGPALKLPKHERETCRHFLQNKCVYPRQFCRFPHRWDDWYAQNHSRLSSMSLQFDDVQHSQHERDPEYVGYYIFNPSQDGEFEFQPLCSVPPPGFNIRDPSHTGLSCFFNPGHWLRERYNILCWHGKDCPRPNCRYRHPLEDNNEGRPWVGNESQERSAAQSDREKQDKDHDVEETAGKDTLTGEDPCAKGTEGIAPRTASLVVVGSNDRENHKQTIPV